MGSVSADTYKKAESTAQELKGKALDKAVVVEDELGRFGHDAMKRVESLASSSLDMARDYAKSGQDYVKSNPVKGIAMAAAAGLVAGGLLAMLLRRKN